MLWIDLIAVLSLLGIGLFIVLAIIICLLLRWPRFNEFWQMKSFSRNLIINQVIGLSLLSLIIFLASIIPSIMELQDTTLDFVMDVHSGNIPPRAEKFPSFVLLDIDDETYESWGKPALTPRDKLTNLIDVAVKAKARLIVVDINLRKPTNKEGPLHSNDQKLVTYLKNYIVQCQTQKDKLCPPIIFVRTLNQETSPLPTPHISFLEKEGIVQTLPYIQWATAEFFSLGPIASVRYWRLWEPICTEDKQPEIIPSTVLLATAMVKECTNEMQMSLTSIRQQSCGNDKTSLPSSLNFCDLSISTNFEAIEQRVMYRIPWSNGNLPYVVHDNLAIPILTILSAKSYAESQPQVSLEPLRDNIVVIGGSYGNDVYDTPIGEMSGPLIMINSIHTLLQNIMIKPVSFLTWFGIGIVFIFIMTLFSYHLSGGWKYLGWIGLAIIIVGLFYYSVIIFEGGTWLNVVVPLVIIKIFHFIYQKPQLQNWAKWLIQKCNH
jgi:CHASE2 domain-containing sensor protein